MTPGAWATRAISWKDPGNRNSVGTDRNVTVAVRYFSESSDAADGANDDPRTFWVQAAPSPPPKDVIQGRAFRMRRNSSLFMSLEMLVILNANPVAPVAVIIAAVLPTAGWIGADGWPITTVARFRSLVSSASGWVGLRLSIVLFAGA